MEVAEFFRCDAAGDIWEGNYNNYNIYDSNIFGKTNYLLYSLDGE